MISFTPDGARTGGRNPPHEGKGRYPEEAIPRLSWDLATHPPPLNPITFVPLPLAQLICAQGHACHVLSFQI